MCVCVGVYVRVGMCGYVGVYVYAGMYGYVLVSVGCVGLPCKYALVVN